MSFEGATQRSGYKQLVESEGEHRDIIFLKAAKGERHRGEKQLLEGSGPIPLSHASVHAFKLMLVLTEVTSVGDVITSSLITRATVMYFNLHTFTNNFKVFQGFHLLQYISILQRNLTTG